MKVLSIGGSNSINSINRNFANFVASLIPNATVTDYNLSKIDLPIYSGFLETTNGIHSIAIDFAKQIDQTDLIILSLAEHNGSYSAAFKNLFDWTSRIQNRKTWGEKPMLLMSSSPGARGGSTVLSSAKTSFSFMGAIIKGTFSLPNFHQNFNKKEGITNLKLKNDLMEIIKTLL